MLAKAITDRRYTAERGSTPARRPALQIAAALAAAALIGGCATTSNRRDAVPRAEAERLVLIDDASGADRSLGLILDAAPVTALVFWSANCPCVRRYQARIDAFAARWRAAGAQVLAVDANPDESAREIARAARERGATTAILRDPGGTVAAALGAKTTPTVVLIRRDGRVAYHGWLDNERDLGDPDREAWADAAMKRTLSGGAFAAQSEQRPVWGCRIPRQLAGAPGTDRVPTPAAAAASGGCGCKVPK